MEIKIPDFLKESENDIHSRMLDNAPPDINVIEGDFFWDATKPTAIEVYNLKNITMQHFLKLVFLQSSEKNFLDMIGAEYGFKRKAATKAIQIIRVNGKKGVAINTNKRVSTKADTENVSIEFQFIESGTIGDNGYIDLKAECLTEGIVGNVLLGTITILTTATTGVSSINNISLYEAGVDAESDEVFRKRILDFTRQPAVSGNVSDYIKWCNSFDGVGGVKVFPLWNGNGTVKCTIMSNSSSAVSQELINKIANYIETVRPIGATVTIESAAEKNINISASVNHISSISLDTIKNEFNLKLIDYFQNISFNKTTISIAQVGSLLLDCNGVTDYSDLKLNDAATNTLLADNEIPIIGTITLS